MPVAVVEDPAEIIPSQLEGQPLGEHNGLPIVDTKTKITGTGDGLSKAMKIKGGVHLPMGGKVYVLTLCRVDSHEYDFTKEAKDSGDLNEVEETAVLVAEGALYVDPKPMRKMMADHLERVALAVARAKEEAKAAKGGFPLPDLSVDEIDAIQDDEARTEEATDDGE